MTDSWTDSNGDNVPSDWTPGVPLTPAGDWASTCGCAPPSGASIADSITITGSPGSITSVVGDKSLWSLVLNDGTPAADFRIDRFGDTGALADSPMTIVRATGVVTFHDPVMLSRDPVEPMEAATRQFVLANAGGITDAPNDGTAYGRKNLAWAHLTHFDITDWATSVPAPYVLPTASTTVLGGVKVDGSTITIAGGVISSTGGSGGGIAEAPNDSTLYGRKSAGWAHLTHTDITDWTATLAPYALTANVPVASSATPIMDGTAAVGTGTTWARADHIHPTDTSRYAVSNPAGYITAAAIPAPYVLPTASTTVLGGVMVDGTTVNIAGGVISAAGAVAVSAIAPSSPVQGSLWFDTNGGQMYVWYNDGNSSQWVPVVNQGYAASSAPLIVRPPAAASWTQRNFGGTTALADIANGVRIFDSSVATVTNTVRGITLSAPSAPYTIDANLSVVGLVTANGYLSAGMGWTDGTKAQVATPLLFGSATVPQNFLQVANYATFATGAVIVSGTSYYTAGTLASLWLRIADDGTNISYAIGYDGITFSTIYSIAKASGYLGSGGYSNVGVWLAGTALNNGGSEFMTLQSWRVH
jgi:hypothetical protein